MLSASDSCYLHLCYPPPSAVLSSLNCAFRVDFCQFVVGRRIFIRFRFVLLFTFARCLSLFARSITTKIIGRCVGNCVFKLLDNPETVKQKESKEAIFRLLGCLIKRHKYSLSMYSHLHRKTPTPITKERGLSYTILVFPVWMPDCIEYMDWQSIPRTKLAPRTVSVNGDVFRMKRFHWTHGKFYGKGRQLRK